MARTENIRLLRDNRDFRRLFSARVVSLIGDAIAATALILHVEATEGSGLAVTALLLANNLPYLLGPLAGAIADRVDQRNLMIACDLGQALIFATIGALLPSFPALVALVASAFVLAAIFRPAGRSAIPALVAPAELMTANAWLGTALNASLAVGPIAGGVLTGAVGVQWAILADASTFLISALLLLRLPALPSGLDEEAAGLGLIATARAGLAFARRHAVARALVAALFFGVMFAAIDDVALVFLVRDELDGSPAAFGTLQTLYGVGMIAVSTALTRWSARVAARHLFVVGFLVNGLGAFLTGLAPALWAAGAAQGGAGVGNGAANVATDTLVQRTVPRPMLGRVFGLVSTAAFVAGAVAYLLGGILLEVTSPRTVFLIGGAGVVVVALLARTALPAVADGAPPLSRPPGPPPARPRLHPPPPPP